MYELEVVSCRLIPERPILSDMKIESAIDAVRLIKEMLGNYDREVVVVLNLDGRGHPINMNISNVGTINQSLVGIGEVYKAAILSNAASIVLIHNHPSGDVAPSEQDIALTDRMARAGHIIGIELLDSIVVGRGKRYHSMKREETVAFNNYPDITTVEGRISWAADNQIDYETGHRKIYLQCSRDLGDPNIGYFAPPNPLWSTEGKERYRLVVVRRNGELWQYPGPANYYKSAKAASRALELVEEEGIKYKIASYKELTRDRGKRQSEYKL